MTDEPIIVVDTNVLLNLATPVVDARSRAPTGEDPLKTVLFGYDVHVPSSVLAEVSEAQGNGDLLSAAADLVFRASHHLTTHEVETQTDEPLEFGLDPGESHGIWLANELGAAMFVTDEFNTTNYLFVSLALEDRNTLFTTPHVLCLLAERGTLDTQYVHSALTYYVETKQWDAQYVSQLRSEYLSS
ncbi:hypothetical protein AB7C87_13605 [Natrarchaeobius sp. A-rgal3]|uniref:hypothetical protein n=1 Tax=Natrarchaeobius versutus TaxID=1679078 RepID=UPI00350F2434